MIKYTAIHLNREQKRELATSTTLNECRDAINRHATKEQLPTLTWATCFPMLVAMTEDSDNLLAPFQIRYKIEAHDAEA